MLITDLPFTVNTHSAEETEAVGAALADLFCREDINSAFLAMQGDLGAGKTAFTRGFASVICPEAKVKSPTFAIVNEYRGKTPIHHMDTYRIKDDDDLYSTGFYDITDGFVVCEWSENISYALPAHRYEIRIEYTEAENERVITVKEIGK